MAILKGLRRAAHVTSEYLDQTVTTKIKHLLLLIVVAFSIFGLLAWSVNYQIDSERADDLRAATLVGYQAEVNNYNVALFQHEACLANSRAAEANRNRFIASAEAKRQMIEALIQFSSADPESPLIAELFRVVDESKREVENDTNLLPPEACPPKPTMPQLPDSLVSTTANGTTVVRVND